MTEYESLKNNSIKKKKSFINSTETFCVSSVISSQLRNVFVVFNYVWG